MGPSFGPGTSLIGAPASQVLNQPSALAQQGPNSAGFQPNLMPPPASAMPQQGAPMGAVPQQQPPQQINPGLGAPPSPQGSVGLPPTNPESAMIVKALTSRLNSLNKIEEQTKIPPPLPGTVPQR